MVPEFVRCDFGNNGGTKNFKRALEYVEFSQTAVTLIDEYLKVFPALIEDIRKQKLKTFFNAK